MNMVVTLTSTLYPTECVEASVSAFAHLCKIDLIGNPTSITAHISVSDESSKVGDEFLNYLLMRSIEQQLTQTHHE
jgi:hypothetical protein